MSNINTGGPAFPSGLVENAADEVDSLHKGMTLRDYFAAKAMQVLLAEVDGPNDDVPGAPRWLPEDASSLAYQIADAMLRAREAS